MSTNKKQAQEHAQMTVFHKIAQVLAGNSAGP